MLVLTLGATFSSYFLFFFTFVVVPYDFSNLLNSISDFSNLTCCSFKVSSINVFYWISLMCLLNNSISFLCLHLTSLVHFNLSTSMYLLISYISFFLTSQNSFPSSSFFNSQCLFTNFFQYLRSPPTFCTNYLVRSYTEKVLPSIQHKTDGRSFCYLPSSSDWKIYLATRRGCEIVG